MHTHLVFRQHLHNQEQISLRLETDTRNLRQLDVAVLDRYPISKSTERLKNPWIGFVAPQPQTRCDVQRHLVTAVRNAADWRPPVVLQNAALHRPSSSPRSIRDRDTRASHAVAQISLSPDNSNRPPHKRRLGRRRLLPENGLRVTGKAAPRRSSPPHPTPPCPAHPPPPIFRRVLQVFHSA